MCRLKSIGQHRTAIAAILVAVVWATPAAAEVAFSPTKFFSAGSQTLFAPHVADLTGDGHPDVIVAAGSIGVAALAGDGTGSLGPAIVSPTTHAAKMLEVGDVNGDGRSDVVVADQSAVTVGLGDGTGRFALSDVFFPDATRVITDIALANMNGDPDLDVLVLQAFAGVLPGGGRISILPGVGNGSFAAAQTIAIGTHPRSFAVGDLDEDGLADVAVAEDYFLGFPHNMSTWNNRTGAIRTFEAIAGDIVLGDLTFDGLPDVVIVGDRPSVAPGSSRRLLLRNDRVFPGNFFGPTFDSTAVLPGSPVFANVDGSGAVDLVVGHVAYDPVWIVPALPFVKAGGLGIPVEIDMKASTSTSGARAVAVGDLNRDGALDLVGAESQAAPGVAVRLSAPFVPSQTIDLGNQALGVAGQNTSIVIQNAGVAALRPTRVAVVGAAVGDFRIQAEGCTGQVVPSGGSCAIVVRFLPTRLGLSTADLEVSDPVAGSVRSIGLRGMGIAKPSKVTSPLRLTLRQTVFGARPFQRFVVRFTTSARATARLEVRRGKALVLRSTRVVPAGTRRFLVRAPGRAGIYRIVISLRTRDGRTATARGLLVIVK